MRPIFYITFVLLLFVGCLPATEVPFIELKGHTGVVYRAVFSPDGKKVITGGTGSPSPTAESVRIWNVESGKELLKLAGVSYAQFSPDGRKIAVDEPQSRVVRIRDVESGKELQKLAGYSSCFFPDNERMFTHGRDGDYRLWNIESGKELQTFEGGVSLVLSPDGKKIAVKKSDFCTLCILDVESGKKLLKLEVGLSAVFSPDGKRIVATDYDARYLRSIVTEPFRSTSRMWDIETGKELHKFEGTVDIFSPDGKKIATSRASVDEKDSVRIWDAESGKELCKLQGDRVCAFSIDGKIVTSDGGHTRIWDAESGKELQILERYFLAISPDGKRIVTGFGPDSIVRIYDLSAMEKQ